MRLRSDLARRVLASCLLVLSAASCGSQSHAPSDDGGAGERDAGGRDAGARDAGRAPLDSGPEMDLGAPIAEDAGPPPPRLCGGSECGASQACCVESGACYELAAEGGCVLVTPPPYESGSGTPCASDADCSATQFCRGLDSCIGAGWCVERVSAGLFCSEEATPVCACDGRSYGSLCAAYAAGVSVSRIGMGAACGEAAPTGAVSCGRDGDCGAGRRCCARTSLCIDADCDACCAPPPPGTELGCRRDADCAALEGRGDPEYFCFGEGCGATLNGGGCLRAAGTTCGGAFAPVCGCDGVTYSNVCWAQTARARLASDGICE